MKKTLFLLIVLLLCSGTIEQGFLSEQRKYIRVRTAINEKDKIIREKLNEKQLSAEDFHILLIGYKAEGILEVYGKKKTEKTYQLVCKYDICASSGSLGPKRRQGDGQIPEGFYYIDRFNPASQFYLSLGLNYPNPSDKIKCKSSNPGGDIFIHGSCVSIGCLPITDEKIKELYLLSVYARNNGQSKIPVYLFPFRMSEDTFEDYNNRYRSNNEMLSFWNNLKSGYDLFATHKQELKITISRTGDYLFN